MDLSDPEEVDMVSAELNALVLDVAECFEECRVDTKVK